jgi:hypothetical protein
MSHSTSPPLTLVYKPFGVAKCLASNPNPVFVVRPLCPPHLRGLVEETVQAVDNSWLLQHAEGEVFKSSKAMRSIKGLGL